MAFIPIRLDGNEVVWFHASTMAVCFLSDVTYVFWIVAYLQLSSVCSK